MPANTPIRALPYPVAADTADVPRDLRALAEKLDTGIPLVTSLPVAPVDGQEVYYTANAGGAVLWHLRYRAANPTAYKWEFLGGPVLAAEVGAREVSSALTYGNLATPGPQIALPLGGVYDIYIASMITPPAAPDAISFASIQFGGGVASDGEAIQIRNPGTGNLYSNVSSTIRRGPFAAQTLKMVYRVNAGTGAWQARYISAAPVCVG